MANSAQDLNRQAAALIRQGRMDEARQNLQQALQLQPDHADTHINLGNIFAYQLRNDEAITHYRRALELAPNNAAAYSNLGITLERQDKVNEAIDSYRQALQLKPDYAQAWSNLGLALQRQDRFQEAVEAFRRAVQLKPDYQEAFYNLGNCFAQHGRIGEAIACQQQALQLQPDFALAHWNHGLLQLFLGNFEQGWPEYEYRSAQPGVARRQVDGPRWDGSPLQGKTVLLYAEQGLGDTLQFIRYAALVKQRGGKVVVECPPALTQLLASCQAIDSQTAAGSPLPAYDFQAPLLSVPGMLNTAPATIPAAIPYLHAEPELVASWRRELEPLQGFKVGIAWQGAASFRFDRQRSVPLVAFAGLAELKGVNLISLQKGHGTEQLGDFVKQWPLLDLGSRLDESTGAFVDTAAVIMNLDLVISCDTSISHLAGALGVPVWTALAYVPDWRWLLEREDSPWYPTMRLFRQSLYGQWSDVFDRMRSVLNAQLGSGTQPTGRPLDTARTVR